MAWFFKTNDGCAVLEAFLYEPFIARPNAFCTQLKINTLLGSVYTFNRTAEEIQYEIQQNHLHLFKGAMHELLVSCFDMSVQEGKPRVDLQWSGFSWLAFKQLHKKTYQITRVSVQEAHKLRCGPDSCSRKTNRKLLEHV